MSVSSGMLDNGRRHFMNDTFVGQEILILWPHRLIHSPTVSAGSKRLLWQLTLSWPCTMRLSWCQISIDSSHCGTLVAEIASLLSCGGGERSVARTVRGVDTFLFAWHDVVCCIFAPFLTPHMRLHHRSNERRNLELRLLPVSPWQVGDRGTVWRCVVS